MIFKTAAVLACFVCSLVTFFIGYDYGLATTKQEIIRQMSEWVCGDNTLRIEMIAGDVGNPRAYCMTPPTDPITI